LIDLGNGGLNIVGGGVLNGADLGRGLLECSGGLLRRVDHRGLVVRAARLRAPLGKALEQLIQGGGNGAARRDIEDVLQRRQGCLELLIHSLQRQLLLDGGIGVGAACVLGNLLNAAGESRDGLEGLRDHFGHLFGIARTVGVGDVVLRDVDGALKLIEGLAGRGKCGEKATHGYPSTLNFLTSTKGAACPLLVYPPRWERTACSQPENSLSASAK